MSSEETQQPWITYGDDAFNHHNYPDALSYYTQALQQNLTNVTLLTKIGNTYFSMQCTTAAEHFYWQAFSLSNAITVIYEYALTSIQATTLPNLQTYLHDTFNVSITIEGLDHMLNTISQDAQQQPPTTTKNHTPYNPFENLVTTLLHHAGIPFSQDLFDIAKQMKHAISEPSQGKHQMILSKRMSWMQLEDFFYQFFQNQGYHVTKTKRSHDQGADLLVKNDTEFMAVQIKKRAKPIGVKGVQEVYAGRGFYGTHRALLISTSGFTRPALKLANKIGVECWDWQQILREFRTHQQPPLTNQDQSF